MGFEEYIAYHKRGDGCIEERIVGKLPEHFGLSPWDTFRLIYYYALCYNIPDSIALLRNPDKPKEEIDFKTDRRYVRIGNRFERAKAGMPDKFAELSAVTTTSEAYKVVSSWYYFGRYAAYLFLECYIYAVRPEWTDDFIPAWERDENYTKGTMIVASCGYDKELLSQCMERLKERTGDSAFSLETSLCAVEKMRKFGLVEGYCSERLLKYMEGKPYEALTQRLMLDVLNEKR